jgi:hypothetical protein
MMTVNYCISPHVSVLVNVEKNKYDIKKIRIPKESKIGKIRNAALSVFMDGTVKY